MQTGGPILVRAGVVCACALVISWPHNANAWKAKEAKIGQLAGQVVIVDSNSVSKLAVAGDALAEDSSVQTGSDARGEVVFGNEARARLGANTTFGFQGGSRTLQLKDGVMLVDAPRKAGRVEVNMSEVRAAVSQGTAVIERHQSSFKFLVLQGTCRLYRPGHLGDSVLVKTGQMVIGNPAAALSDPVDFDVDRFVKTCRLINGFDSLANEKKLTKESQKQAKAKGRRELIDTNLVIFGEGTKVSLVGTAPEASSTAPAAQAPPPQQIQQSSETTMGLDNVDKRPLPISR